MEGPSPTVVEETTSSPSGAPFDTPDPGPDLFETPLSLSTIMATISGTSIGLLELIGHLSATGSLDLGSFSSQFPTSLMTTSNAVALSDGLTL